MKIALITKRVSHSLGGAERISAVLSSQLSNEGHDVHIFSMVDTGTKIQGAHVRPQKISTWFSPWKLLSFNRRIQAILRAESFDIIYSLCQVFPIDIYRAGDGIHKHWMRIQYPNRILRTLKYLTSLVHLAMRWLENKIFTNENCIFFITNSSLIKKQIIEHFHIPEKKIKVIYNGVDTTLFNPRVKIDRELMRKKYFIDNDTLVLLFVSHNWKRKGLSTIIEALPKTGIERIRVVVVGRGEKRKYISFSKKRRISTDKLIFAGSSEDVEKYYGMADIFVLPSKYEPFSNACLEAMACGIPVITTKTNGASELIRNGVNGFILDDWRNSHLLADMIKILEQHQTREEIGKNAAETAKEYTWGRHIKETMEVFKSYKS